MISNVVILGSGNLAEALVKAMLKSRINISQIYSRNVQTGNELAKLGETNFTDDLTQLEKNADAYFFVMNDEANVETIAKMEVDAEKIYVHTAGSQSINIFSGKAVNYGAFYPFQTFTRGIDIDFSDVPICIEASNVDTLEALNNLANRLWCDSYEMTEEQRKIVHLSGVFACNFMNHCVAIGEKTLATADISLDILQPLLKESFRKIIKQGAMKSQTGPAVRNDKETLFKHLSLLQDDKELYTIYKSMSDNIHNVHNK